MDQAGLCPAPEVACGGISWYRRPQRPAKETASFRSRGIERWHRAVSTDLVKQNVLVPKEESSGESDTGFHESQQNQKKKLMRKMRTAFGRVLPQPCRSNPARLSQDGTSGPGKAPPPRSQPLLQRLAGGLPTPRLFRPRVRRLSQSATVQLDVVEAETEEVTGGSAFLRARRTTHRLSVTSLPSGLQKVSYSSKKRPYFLVLKKKKRGMENILQKPELTVGELQMQVDDLIETVTDKSMKLLAQRHAELQQCEFLGDEILQSSRQFQRTSRRTMRKYRLKNVCLPCTRCCS